MFATRLMLLSVTATLLSGCVQEESFGTATKAEWCRALLDAAPSASTQDTPQTLEEVADIGDVIATLCPDVSKEIDQ